MPTSNMSIPTGYWIHHEKNKNQIKSNQRAIYVRLDMSQLSSCTLGVVVTLQV